MAIIISEEKKQFSWIPVLMVSLLFLAVIVGAYLLFFSATPLIEYIAPSSQKTISDISVINSNQFKSDISAAKQELQAKTQQGISGPSSTGGSTQSIGRDNPFLPF
jgi:hypothetical protein